MTVTCCNQCFASIFVEVHVDFSRNWLMGTLSTEFASCTNLKTIEFTETYLSWDLNEILESLPTTLGTSDDFDPLESCWLAVAQIRRLSHTAMYSHIESSG